MYDIAALGELLIDFTCASTDADGYPTLVAHPGGAPANFLAAAASLGAKTALLGKVGADVFGRLLLGTLSRLGIDTSGIIVSDDEFTTLAFVVLDDEGEREFSFARKPGADTRLRPCELRLDIIDAAAALHFGSLSLTDEPSRQATRDAVAYARSRGKLISFDPNLRRPLWRDPDEARRQMLWGLEQADVVKISDGEADFLFGLSPMEAAGHMLERFGTKLVFVTCGAEGCVYRSAKAAGSSPALRGLDIIDTTGAGDIFGGAALYKLLRSGRPPEALSGDELAEIAAFACAAAGLSATKPGGLASVPAQSELADALAAARSL